MQAKQTSLLKRVDALDEECEELQSQLGENEERQIGLHNQLQQMSEEKEQVQAQLTQQQDLCSELQREKQTLETHISELKKSVTELEEGTQAFRERERLLVAFPELSPLAQNQPQSTGNVLMDMERQLHANNIRIKVLEQENATLHTSLLKLRERVQNNNTRVGHMDICKPEKFEKCTCALTLFLLCATGRATAQHGWDAVTEGRRPNEEEVVRSQLRQGIRYLLLLPPPRHCNSTFRPSTSTRTPLLQLKATQRHAVAFSLLAPGAQIRGENETECKQTED
uniref:Uncharacterized protein n=1 Tax=Labrus bergylta TaxID=56723 RepID=A0A3Q3GBE2_9LABR